MSLKIILYINYLKFLENEMKKVVLRNISKNTLWDVCLNKNLNWIFFYSKTRKCFKTKYYEKWLLCHILFNTVWKKVFYLIWLGFCLTQNMFYKGNPMFFARGNLKESGMKYCFTDWAKIFTFVIRKLRLWHINKC